MINLYQQISNKNNFQTYYLNQKFYIDYLHRIILKNIISNDTLLSFNIIHSKFSSYQIRKIIDIYKNSMLCIDIVNRLTWVNLPKKLNYLNILYLNKEIIINIDKLNKNIFPDNFDNRIKRIIENPLEMFKFLRKEKDFTKWLKFLDNRIMELFYTPISLSSDDITVLGKILFLLINIKEQNISSPDYVSFIEYCNSHQHLILLDTRINLKIKEHFSFIKISLNLGILTKHIIYNKTQTINIDNITLEQQYNKLTQKYNKYKTKYNHSKNPNATEYPFSETSHNE